MNFDIQKKSIVYKFNSFIIKGTTSLEVCNLNVKKSKEHSLLHETSHKPSRLIEVFKEPEQVLKNANYKENLKTYVSLISKGKVLFKEQTDLENKLILGLLKHKEKYWKDLLINDIHTFVYLTKLLDFDAYNHFRFRNKQFEMVKIKKELLNTKKLLEIIKDNPKISTPIMTHMDFCLNNNGVDPLKIIDREYKRMLNYILYDQKIPIEKIQIGCFLYKEIEMFNKFLEDSDYFNEYNDEYNNAFKMINERGVRDFILDKKMFR